MHLPWRSLGLLAGLLIIGPVRPGVLGAQQPITITGRVTNDAGAPLSLASDRQRLVLDHCVGPPDQPVDPVVGRFGQQDLERALVGVLGELG